jgi:hypothetical protein
MYMSLNSTHKPFLTPHLWSYEDSDKASFDSDLPFSMASVKDVEADGFMYGLGYSRSQS